MNPHHPAHIYDNARIDGLIAWVADEPAYRRFEIDFVGEPGDHENVDHRAAWRVRVWSQKRDGTPRKPKGEGVADTLEFAAYRALDAYFNTPKPKDDE